MGLKDMLSSSDKTVAQEKERKRYKCSSGGGKKAS